MTSPASPTIDKLWICELYLDKCFYLQIDLHLSLSIDENRLIYESSLGLLFSPSLKCSDNVARTASFVRSHKGLILRDIKTDEFKNNAFPVPSLDYL